MYVYLVRHAIAFEPDPTAWPDDRERPLTPEGEKSSGGPRAGSRRWSKVEWCSAARSHAPGRRPDPGEVARWPSPLRFEPLEPGRSPAEVVEGLQPHAGAARCAGRARAEPARARRLSAGKRSSRVRLLMRKGSVACLAFEGWTPGWQRAARVAPAAARPARDSAEFRRAPAPRTPAARDARASCSGHGCSQGALRTTLDARARSANRAVDRWRLPRNGVAEIQDRARARQRGLIGWANQGRKGLQARAVLVGQPHGGGQQRNGAVRKARQVGGEHDRRGVLVAVVEVDAAADVQQRGRVQQRLAQLAVELRVERP